ncbi:bombyxin B-1 homolog [Centruroides vittatus]|uniref:bombyxin B-1 homolog n=1 Tax=Centruroides vittatus TaxID=120091 RepID=UPI0035100465
MKTDVRSTLLCLTFTWVCMAHLVSSSPFQHRSNERRSIKACGSILAETVRLACSTITTTPIPEGKRFAYNYDDLLYPDLNLLSKSYGFSNPRLASSFLSQQNKKRGIVDECCRKSCTFEHLLLYCPT